jgi:hypothetical protein
MPVYTDQSMYQFIGNVTRSTNTTIATLPAGAVGIFNEEGVSRTADLSTVATLPVRIVKKKADGTLLFSPFFTLNDIVQKEWTDYTAPTEQVTLLGVNSASTVTGLGTVTVGNTYIVDIELLHAINDTNNSPMIKTTVYQAVSGDTQASIAKGLFESSQRVLARNLPYPMITVERIADGTGGTSVVAFTGTSTIVKLTKGSKSVGVYIKVADGTADLSASTASVGATDVFSFPSTNGRSFSFTAVALGSGAGHTLVTIGETNYLVADGGTDAQNATAIAAAINAGTQATAAVTSSTTVTITYKATTTNTLPPLVLKSDDDSTWTLVTVTIASGTSKAVKYVSTGATTTAATFAMDEPWQGETGYVYEGTTEATNAGVATFTTAAVWGLKYAGIAQPFDATTGKYQKVKFYIQPNAALNNSINPYTGNAYTYALGFDGSVSAYDVQAATEGSGAPEQVGEEESLLQWQNKNVVLQVYPQTSYVKETDYSKRYALTTLVIKKQLSGMPGIQPATYMSLNIAVDTSLTTNDNAVLKTVFTIS